MNVVANISEPAGELTARDWARLLAPYGTPDNKRGLIEIAITVVPYLALWGLTAGLLCQQYWWGLLLLIPLSAFLLRLFLIQHDCGHGAFFKKRVANDWTGRLIGVLTFTPYFFWKYAHNMHHAGSGNLSRRGFGDIDTLTVKEYRARSRSGRLMYRLYRHPFVMFAFGPGFTFLIDQRFPFGQMKNGWRPWISTMGTNLTITLLSLALITLTGWQVFLIIQLSTAIIAATIGVWLFFVQHQFEEMSWDHEDRWNWHEAALYGSTHYDLPQPIRWFTANIGLHHIHHLSSRIPYYRLPQVVKDFPRLAEINRLTFFESFKCVPLALWDEKSRTMLSFKAAGF